MGLFDNLAMDTTIEDDKDIIGGMQIFESGLYNFTIEMAYINVSAGGAMALVLQLKTDKGETLKQSLWMTSGTKKGCKNFYLDKNKNKRYLPGFIVANAIAQLTVGDNIGSIDTDKKVLKIYDFAQSKEVPKEMDVFLPLLNQQITLGVIKQIVDKSAKDNLGNYVPTGQTREENEVVKVFSHDTKQTTTELKANENAEFYTKWEKKWKNQTKDKTSKTKPAAAPSGVMSGSPVAGSTLDFS